MPPVVHTLEQLKVSIAQQPDQWRPLVFTNGCFDLIHAGHVRYLTAAKALGRSLIVGLNRDASVRQLKPQPSGCPTRPIIPEQQRAEVVAALKPVNAVLLFSESTACQAIATLQPDIYVKGGDYQLNTLPEASTVRAYGGKIHLIPIELSCSTSAIIQTIMASS
ncbi:MAG: adenylyltransferase/cytidyltransferase family protein [Cyanobacteria bacterium J06626_14]